MYNITIKHRTMKNKFNVTYGGGGGGGGCGGGGGGGIFGCN